MERRPPREPLTPIDREDIHALVRALHDVIDDIDASTDMLCLYRIAYVHAPILNEGSAR